MLSMDLMRDVFELHSVADPFSVTAMAALQFLSKYRETGLLLIRVSLGIIFLMLITPVLWSGQSAWDHFGSAMRYLDIKGHYKFWGFVGAVAGCAGGVLMILGLFFRVGVLLALAITLVHLVAVWDSHGDFYARLPALEMSILLLSLLFIGPGKYSVDKG
jgi:putative oxidoreductase